MIADIRKRLERLPFSSFSIRTSDGHEYPVPTLDHIYLPPGGHRVIVSDDSSIVAILTPLHISGLVERPTEA
ncbi:MAG: hypothetical protein ABI233_10585 [Chthoniobacterales bacterium]